MLLTPEGCVRTGALQVREDFLVEPTLPGTSFWGIPSYPKSLGIWKGRGVHWKEQNPHSICLGLHWSCEGNLSVLDLQCRALVMLPFGGSQALSFLGHSALLHPSAVKTQMVSQGWGLRWVLTNIGYTFSHQQHLPLCTCVACTWPSESTWTAGTQPSSLTQPSCWASWTQPPP